MPRDVRVTGEGATPDWTGEVWASSTQAEATLDVRVGAGEPAINFDDGYEETYSENAGSKVTRAQFNWFFRLITALVKEINEGGVLLEWDDYIDYSAVARVVGSDGNEYKAVQASTGQDPVADTANTYWARMVPDAITTPTATTARQGTVEYASVAERTAGTTTNRVPSIADVVAMITARVQGRLLPATDGTAGQFLRHDGTYGDLPAGVGAATTTSLGTVEYASAAEVTAGTRTDRVASLADIVSMITSRVPPSRLLPAADGTAGQFLRHDGTYSDLPTILHPPAREDFVGTVELATEAEVTAGASNTVVPTVLRTSQQIDARIPESRRLPAADGTAGQFLRHDGEYADLPSASATQSGLSEFATTTEVEANSATRVVTPSVLPIKKVVTYTATQDITAANVAGTLHLKAE